MQIKNLTKHRVPRKWLQKMLNHLGVNPVIEITYADNPEEVKHPNYIHKIGRTKKSLDGLALDTNRVYIYVGRWKDGNFEDYTPRFVKWLLLHELRHQYYFYHLGNIGDPWKGLKMNERIEREERACNRFANLVIGVPNKHYPILRKDVKSKRKPTAKSSSRRKN